jgi:hypothetical protein
MASKTAIANRALSKLGETRVSNVDIDNTKPAKVIRFMYDIVRDAMLAAYPWNFAIKRVQIAADASAPAWGYSKQYTLPVDFLSLLEIKGNPEYRIESGKILTNEGAPIYIRYIAQITDTGLFDALFVEAFATRMAYEGCEEITQSNTKKDLLARDLQGILKEAYANNAIQGQPQALEADTWLLSRESTGYYDEIDYNL